MTSNFDASRKAAFPPGSPKAEPDSNVVALRDKDADDQNPDAAILANPQLGSVAMLSMAASFTDTPATALIAATHYNLVRTIDLHGEFNMTSGGGTLEHYARKALDGIDKDDPDDKGDSDDNDAWDRYADIAEQQRKDDREREDWARSAHSFAGLTAAYIREHFGG